ncbi:recombinase family protein [Fusobacterium varium]
MKNKKIIGYIRISTKKQKLERQEENILKIYPEAKIIKEVFTGTTQNRPEWQKLKKKVDNSYKLIFDSVSRMSRSADEGVEEYFELLEKGVELEFLKEPYINTKVYEEQLKINNSIQVEDKNLNETILKGVREYLKRIAEQQIKIAFEQAEKEVLDLRERTKEGLRETKKRGTKLGRVKGRVYETKKSKEMKEKIKKLSKDFEGNLKDIEVLDLLKIARMSYYKYKKQLFEEQQQQIRQENSL